MLDLGKYTGTVLSAYGAAIALLVVLVVVTMWQGAKMKRCLAEMESRLAKGE